MKIYVNESQINTINNALQEQVMDDYFSLVYVDYNGEEYMWDNPDIAEPFFGFVPCEAVVKERGTTHSKYSKFFRDPDLCLYGRIWYIDGKIFIIYHIPCDYMEHFGNPSLSMIVSVLRNALAKSSFSSNEVYYACDYSKSVTILREDKQEHPEEWDEFKIGGEGGGCEYYHVLKESADLNSDEFKAWFGNSVCVDKDGQPTLFYHSSPAKFDAFDPDKIGCSGSGSYHGYGFNFTRGYNSNYGKNTYGCYLKLEKPLSNEKLTLSTQDITEIIVKADEGEVDSLVVNITGNNCKIGTLQYYREIRKTVQSILEYSRDDLNVYATICISSNAPARKIMKIFSEYGYDGSMEVLHDRIAYAVVFSNDQIMIAEKNIVEGKQNIREDASDKEVGIYINCDKIDFADLIANSGKTIETRNANKNGKCPLIHFVKERVGLVKTMKNKKPYLFGYARIGEPISYGSEEEFYNDIERHKIDKNNPRMKDYHWKEHKLGFPLIDFEPCEPKELHNTTPTKFRFTACYLNEGRILQEYYSRNDINWDDVDRIEFDTSADIDDLHEGLGEYIGEKFGNEFDVVYNETTDQYEEINDNGEVLNVYKDSDVEDLIQKWLYENMDFEISAYDLVGDYLGCVSTTQDRFDFEGIPDEYQELIMDKYNEKPSWRATYEIREIKYTLFSNCDDIDYAAKNMFRTAETYDRGMHGYVLRDGTIILMPTGGDHAQIQCLKGVKDKWEFVKMGNPSFFENSLRIGGILTWEQKQVIGRLIRSYSDDKIYVDFLNGPKGTQGCKYTCPNYQGVFADIERYYNEGIIPLGENVEKHDNPMNENYEMEVSPSQVDLSSFELEDSLEPQLWHDNILDGRARLQLLDIADDFIETLNVKWVKPKDIILTGSICNFNWSSYSDIDLHILIDFTEVDERTELVKEYFDTKKNEWNNEHTNLSIYGYDVELYVQDIHDFNESKGIYSLERNEWISQPSQDEWEDLSESEEDKVKMIASSLMTYIDEMCDEFEQLDDKHKIEMLSHEAEKVSKQLKDIRSKGLENEGEMSVGNIVYKELRRENYLDKLWDLTTRIYDKLNSVE